MSPPTERCEGQELFSFCGARTGARVNKCVVIFQITEMEAVSRPFGEQR